MAIETLDDIVEEVANRIGIYGGCKEHEEGRDCHDCNCRAGFTGDLIERIRTAARVELILERANHE